jgi:peptidoglycan/LPS O-acetylase OafA/YrhL
VTAQSAVLVAPPLVVSTRHVTALDGFRGCAVLLVVLVHYLPHGGLGPLAFGASMGWTGVDAFLVLSAYLITGILYRQRGADDFFQNFYMRRALRLFPLYYFILLLTVAATPFLHIHWRLWHVPLFLYATNYALLKGQSLGCLGPLTFGHLWTLALEEQFYLLWPWVIGSRLSREALVRICWIGLAVTLCLRIVLVGHVNAWFLYESLPTRIDSLFAGALLALAPLPSVRTAWIGMMSAAAVLAAVVVSTHTGSFASKPMASFGYSVLAVLYASLLTLGLHEQTLVARFLSLRVLRFYGRYSYGLYLWHYIFTVQVHRFISWMASVIPIPAAASLLSFAVVLLGATAVAVLSFRFIEEPFLRLKQRYECTALVLTSS